MTCQNNSYNKSLSISPNKQPHKYNNYTKSYPVVRRSTHGNTSCKTYLKKKVKD